MLTLTVLIPGHSGGILIGLLWELFKWLAGTFDSGGKKHFPDLCAKMIRALFASMRSEVLPDPPFEMLARMTLVRP